MGKPGPKPDGLVVVWFRIAPEVLARIKALAAERGCTLSQILRELVDASLAAKEGKTCK